VSAHRFIRTLPILVLLLCAGPIRAQRTAEPDPLAVTRATELRQKGSSAETVGRDVRSTYRQSGPQMIVILMRVGYVETEIARAVAAETRSDGSMAAMWLAEGAVPVASAYAVLYNFDRSGSAAMRNLIGGGYPVRESVSVRHRAHPADVRGYLSDLRLTTAAPRDVGGVLNNVLSASAANAAADMLHAGYDVLAVALALRDGYGLAPAQIGNILVGENVAAVDVLVAFLEPAFGLSELAALTAYRSFGGGADQAAVVLRDRGRTPGHVTPLLTQAGYGAVAIGSALEAAYTITDAQVAAFLFVAGHSYTAVTSWMASADVANAEAVAILRTEGVAPTPTASAMMAAGMMTSAQHGPFAGWARQAGHACPPVATALKVAFQAPIEHVAADLFQAGCTADGTFAALEFAFSVNLDAMAGALTYAGLAADAIAIAMLNAGHAADAVAGALLSAGYTIIDVRKALIAATVDMMTAMWAVSQAQIADGVTRNQALSTTATAFELTIAQAFPIVITFMADFISLEQSFAWLRSEGVTAQTAAKWARDAGQGSVTIATALRDAFGATALAVGQALASAGFDAVQVVRGLKDGLSVTYDEMLLLAPQLGFQMQAMLSAITQVYG
jgi:hypothetical protein